MRHPDAGCRPSAEVAAEPVLFRAHVNKWFSGKGNKALKAICDACPIEQACLDAVMLEEAGETYRKGFRGGMSPGERLTLTMVDDRYAVPAPEPSLLERAMIVKEAEDATAESAVSDGRGRLQAS